MFVRPPPPQRGLSLSRLSPSLRPRLAPRSLAIQQPQPFPSTPSRRQFLTRSNLLPWRRKTSASNPYGSIPQRPLATAMDDPISTNYPYPQSQMPPYNLKPFDPSAPLIVKSTYDPFPRVRATSSGLPGGVEDMLSVFDACLQVNKLDRAALVLKRLGGLPGVMPDDELIALHNRYLQTHIDQAFEQSNDQWAQALHQWFELEIHAKELPPTPETIAYMLKVSILSSRGPKLQRLVERYMEMIPEDDMIDVLGEEDILTQQDLGVITSIYQPASSMKFDDMEISQVTDAEAEVQGAESTSPVPDTSESKSDNAEPVQVRAVEQKGFGLKTLRSVLAFFEEIKGQDLSSLPLNERREIQARLEKDAVDAAVHRWREENKALQRIGRSSKLSSRALNAQLYEWHCAIEERLKQEFSLFEESETRQHKTEEDLDRCIYAPFLRQSTPERLAAVTILSVLTSGVQQGIDKPIVLSLALNNLAKAVEDDIRSHTIEKEFKARKAKHAENRKRMFQLKKQQQERQQLGAISAAEAAPISPTESEAAPKSEDASNVVECSAYETRSWPVFIRAKVGAVLLSTILDTAKVNVVREHPETKALITQAQPAFAHSNIQRKGKKTGVVIPNKWLIDLMKSEPSGDFLARHLPMLVEPEPWSKFDKGGFITSPVALVRTKAGEKDQRIYAEAAINRGDMDQVKKGLDVLGRTGWRINTSVFNVMLEAWNSGQKIADIPPLNPDLPIPPEPAPSEDMMHRREWLKQVKLIENEKSGLHSQRCFINFQLEIARSFKDQTFYFPHNVDFRGRAYPIPSYLNHMGADHARGLLQFAAGRELGERGLHWLKVHLSNVFGYDKASLQERESFAMDNLSNIIDSATNPLDGKRWWLEAEDPWQCLAACFELKAALESPEPTKHVSHLPVHMDGTCNGLQHYAALGGDVWGAQQVNLVPGDRPADVYSAVADLVKEKIAEDIKADSFLAKAVEGKITRKVVKQTVMTNVYGVTYIGAKAQVLKQLDAAYPKLEKETGVPSIVLASYIATKIFKALSTMFRGAHDIQHWLGECAGRVSRTLTPEQLDRLENAEPKKLPINKAKKKTTPLEEMVDNFRSTIVWTTPLRMPVVQPYRKSVTRTIETSLQDLNLQIPERSDPVNRRKQLQAFPPNFVHSLDASHMLLSALECDELGLSFAAVHDSFWTHAADIDSMNRVLRDAFIRIHSEDVIGRLAAEFEARYRGSLYLSSVEPGTALEKEIKAHRKKNKTGLRDELFTERERQRLLRSDDPAEVERGRALVTPATIFEAHAATAKAAAEAQIETAKDEIEEVALGHVPASEVAATEAAEASLQKRPPQPRKDDDGHHESALGAASEVGEHFSLSKHMPGAGADAEFEIAGSHLDDVDHVRTMMNHSPFELEANAAKKDEVNAHKKPKKRTALKIWLPLEFPDIPKKGDFDVAKLKDSEYFFS